MADSWFGNKGLFKPLREKIGCRFHLICRLHSNINLFDFPGKSSKGRGRPRLYGGKVGNASLLAHSYRELAKEVSVNLYGKVRTVMAYDKLLMLKTLKCAVED